MASMVERMLEIANDLIRDRPHSSAARRRAVSTAYYAAFHAFAKTCTSELVPSEGPRSLSYQRIYRALGHGALKSAREKPGPLKQTPTIREILDLMNELREAREDADYAPPQSDAMQLAVAKDHVERGREIVDRLGALHAADRKALAVHLLVKDTRERRRAD